MPGDEQKRKVGGGSERYAAGPYATALRTALQGLRRAIPADAKTLRDLILHQNPQLLGYAQRLARTVAALEPDPRYPGTVPRVLIHGGFVRDAVCRIIPKDLDLQVYGLHPQD